MRYNWFYIVFVVISIVCLTNMMTLKGLIPPCFLVDRECGDVLYSLSSGVFSGFVVYLLTVAIPQWRERKRAEKEIRGALKKYVEYAIERIENLGVTLNSKPEEENEKNEERNRIYQEFSTNYTYSMRPRPNSDSVFEVLWNIKSSKEDTLDDELKLNYPFLIDSSYNDIWRSLAGKKLFNPKRKYVGSMEDEIADDCVEIGRFIADYYWELKDAEQKLK